MNAMGFKAARVLVGTAGLCASIAHAQQFQRVIGTGGDERFNGVARTTDGGTIEVGLRSGPLGFGLEDVYVVKSDAFGIVQWDLNFGTPAHDKAYDVEQTRDGGYIVACESSILPGFEIGLLRLDPLGNIIWARLYPGTYEADPVHVPTPGVDVEELPDGTFVAIGRSLGRPVLFRVTAAGATVFHATYLFPSPNDPARASFTDVDFDPFDQTLVISGSWDRMSAASTLDALLMKTNLLGAPAFTRTYSTFSPAGGPVEESGDGIDVLRDGTYLLCGRTDLAIPGDVHIQAWRTDPLGNPIWNMAYPGFPGPGSGVHFESAYRAIEVDDNNRAAIAGRYFPPAPVGGPSRAVLLAFDAGGGAPLFTWSYLAGARQWAEDLVVMRSCGWSLAGLIADTPVGVGGLDGYHIKTRENGSSGCREEPFPPLPVPPPLQATFIQLVPTFNQFVDIWPAQGFRLDSRNPEICFDRCCFRCPADLSGSADPNDPGYGRPDCMVDSSDFFYFLDQFVVGNLAVADISGSADPNDPAYGIPDGMIDSSDFFYFLDLFVRPCP